MTIADIPGIYDLLEKWAEEDASNSVYSGGKSGRFGDLQFENHLIGNAKARAKRRGLRLDCYVLYVAYFIEAYIEEHPTYTTESDLSDGYFAPIVEADNATE